MTPHILELREFQTKELPADALPEQVGEFLWSRFPKEIQLEPPSFKTGQQWRLTPQGWVGHIPVSDALHIHIEPKVEIDNLFRMLEYAYRLEFLATGDLVGASSLQDFYERIAHILALRVLDRSRRGLQRAYLERSGRLSFLRGKLVLESMLAEPWETTLHCRYEENTADIEDNQILAWTLYLIARAGLSRPEVAQAVRRAFRTIQSVAELRPFRASACVGRHYNRLNADYLALHALCRFFLDHSGPSHDLADRSMLPFLIDMARLFELFVAEWLRQHLPPNLTLKEQTRVVLGTGSTVEFRIDLVLLDRSTGAPVALIDTKYKSGTSPAAGDVEQVIAYAKALGCPEAVLVYPQSLAVPFDHLIGGDIHVWTSHFTLSGDLQANGKAFLRSLMKHVDESTLQVHA